MRKSVSIKARSCCSSEKGRLMDVLRTCDYCTETMEERHLCYRAAAKNSGRRARQCLIAT